MSDIKTNYSGKKLYKNFTIMPPHEMNVFVDLESKSECYKYLINERDKLIALANLVAKEADKYIQD